MTYSECIDDTDYTSTSIWNNLQYISASGPSDICSPKWIRSLERKLDTFRSLQENWDSYGAHPINDGALENAKQFLNSALFSGLEKPLVAATSRGGVHVEWDNNGRALELEFISMTELHYYYADSNEEREKELHSDFEEARIAARELID